MNPQAQPELGHGAHGHDLRGVRFGWLEPLRVVLKRHYGNKWLCVCRCGRHCQRYAATLWTELKEKRSGPRCRHCSQLERAKRVRGKRAEKFLTIWGQEGELYNDAMDRRYANEIRRAIAERLGIDEPQADDAPKLPIWSLQLGDAIEQVQAVPLILRRTARRRKTTARQLARLQAQAKEREEAQRKEREAWQEWEQRRAAREATQAAAHARVSVPAPPGQSFEEACAAANEWMRRAGVLVP